MVASAPQLSTGCDSAAPGPYWFGCLAAPGWQIRFENAVNLFIEHDLEALAQTGRWSDDSEHRSFWQETNLSFSGKG